MADLKNKQIRDSYMDVLTKGTGTAIEDGDGNAFIGAIVNSLTSTSTTAPLAANQGKELQDTKAGLAGGADANFTAMPQVGGNPIVASGSNSDGEWIRFADGTQIVSTIYINLGRGDDASGNLFRTNPAVNIDYPLSFTEIPTVSVSAERTGAGSTSLWGLSTLNKESPIDALEKAIGVRCLSSVSTVSNDIEARVTAIGRWF